MGSRIKVRSVAVALVIAALLGLPAAASALTYTFNDMRNNFPANQTEGPAGLYPATIPVSGVEGTVNKVSVTFFGLGAGDELDLALQGPNGQSVMLLSDACSAETSFFSGAGIAFWTFDDAGPTTVPNKCGFNSLDTRSTLRPTNNSGPDSDAFPAPGPQGVLPSQLSPLAGGSANGSWNLWAVDDKAATIGWAYSAWSLHLDVTPPPPPPPQIVTVQVPVVPAKTGKRAAALAKCKKKPTPAKKAACRAKAKKLPL